jgi:hypothetical protein
LSFSDKVVYSVIVLAIIGISLSFVIAQNTIKNQEASYNEMLRDKGYASMVEPNGVDGRFFGADHAIYVRTADSTGTNFKKQKACEIFLHELGHYNQMLNGDKCFEKPYSDKACEEGAEQYAKENAWRCEKI